jgi:single-strand DNA-binding protein
MAKIMLVGNLGADAEVKKVNDSEVINFNLAENQKTTNRKTGEIVERTNWYSCSYFVSKDSKLVNFLKKGGRVFVEGDLVFREYVTQNKTVAVANNVVVKDLMFLDVKQDS